VSPRSKLRLAFLTSHPIQYHAAWFRALAKVPGLEFEALYCHTPAPADQGIGFGVPFTWDIPLLDGYPHRFLRNVAATPSTAKFGGLDTPELASLIRLERYDAVVVNGWHYKSAWQGILACWRHKVPVLVRSDSHLRTARHPVKTMLKGAPYRWFVPRLNACLPVGQWSADYFRHYGAKPDRVFVVPHAVNPSFESDSKSMAHRRTEFRDRWGLKSTETAFLFVGKFVENKRPIDFVRAIERAHAHSPHVVGLMVGDGPLRRVCERIVDESRLPIRFTGFLNQSEIVQAYIAADALTLLSKGETWGLVVNEAMSCARPCLVSDRVGCGPDLVSPGKTGHVFPFGDVDVLSARMLEGACRPEHLIAMGENARLKMIDHSVPAAVDRLMDALQGVLAS
jgi:glycosyltransferase involved in cell wall biosynthesis